MVTYSDDTNDFRLVQRTADGDAAAFSELYDRYATLVFSVAYKILTDREEARDVLQQVFLKLHRKASLYSCEKGKPASWLASMTRNQSLDRLRQIKRHRALGERMNYEATIAKHSPPPLEGYARYSDEVDLLHGAMSALRPDEVLVLHLAYFGGLSQTEISIELAQPLGSIKARIRRALTKLRTALNGVIEQHSASSAGHRAHAPMSARSSCQADRMDRPIPINLPKAAQAGRTRDSNFFAQKPNQTLT